ncbi:MAG: DUF262 domain-containing protein [Chloroflexota bacterium]|nr:DUF262 domain-containing protein [Chloroflexota bacterium]
MTTLCILLAAMRDAARATLPDVATQIHALYLTNQLMTGLDRLKVLPTQADREAFFEVIESPRSSNTSPITAAYSYFVGLLRGGAGTQPAPDLPRLQRILLDKLNLVSIKLAPADNAYRIFESLNAKGMRLTQSDLLRNYFFMRLPPASHDELYSNVWSPMQERVDRTGERKNFESYIRDALVKDGDFTRNDEVYQSWKTKLDKISDGEIAGTMEELAAYSHYYARFIDPDREESTEVAIRLRRLNRWGGTTIYPFLLNLYGDVDAGRIDASGLAEILTMIESYLVRRLFANVAPNALNRIFIRLYRQIPDDGSMVDATRTALSAPGLRWPGDIEFEDSILTYRLYLDSRPDQRKLILERIEDDFDEKERMDFGPLEIEHIMPQTLTTEWRDLLGASAEDKHRRLLHTLGNLTLTGHNPELSNHPFQRKQDLYLKSKLAMNREVAEAPSWGESEVLARGRRLAQRAIRLWPGPIRTPEAADDGVTR